MKINNDIDVPVSRIRIMSLQEEQKKKTNDVDFILVLTGEISLKYSERTYLLNRNDIVLVHSYEKPSINASGSNLVMIVSIKHSFFVKNGVEDTQKFICNSSYDKDRDYSELRKIISDIAITHFNQDIGSDIRLNELSYSLLYYLLKFHDVGTRTKTNTEGYEDRKIKVIDYLEQNYMKQITLNEIAELTHLNSNYLCRFLKKKTGDTFYGYLKRIRLQHAIVDLDESDKPITSIAYENGFSSPASFCKIFAEEYGYTPSEYRKNKTRASSVGAKETDDEVDNYVEYHAIEEELQNLASRSETLDFKSVHFPSQKHYIIENIKKNETVNPIWNKLINLGYGKYLVNAEYQKQLKMLQNEIGFEYGRVEGLLNDNILMSMNRESLNFTEFDRIINIMLENKIRPYIDLSMRGANVLLPGGEKVLYRYYDNKLFSQNFLERIGKVIKHCINTYGIDEVNHWIFDIGIYHSETLRLLETPKTYAKRAKKAMEIIREYLTDALVGGIAYNGGMSYGTFESIVKEIAEEGFRPDFISTCIFPYEPVDKTNTELRKVSQDPDHIINEILSEKSILERYPDITQRIWLAAMGASIQIQDFVNDTCFQGVYFANNTISLIGLVDVIGYYQLSDISEEYSETSRILYGASGIISRNGLKKTGFSVLKALTRMNKKLLQKDDGFIATTNGLNTYNLLMCNYSYYNEEYCKSGGIGTSVENVYSSFANFETRAVDVLIKGLKEGRYKIVVLSISREHGSLFDEWMRFGILDDLQPMDISYLDSIVHPQRSAQYVDCREGSIEIKTQLLPHEIKFYEIYRMI